MTGRGAWGTSADIFCGSMNSIISKAPLNLGSVSRKGNVMVGLPDEATPALRTRKLPPAAPPGSCVTADQCLSFGSFPPSVTGRPLGRLLKAPSALAWPTAAVPGQLGSLLLPDPWGGNSLLPGGNTTGPLSGSCICQQKGY